MFIVNCFITVSVANIIHVISYSLYKRRDNQHLMYIAVVQLHIER